MNVAEFPEKLQFLFEPARIKVLYGGRDGAKSWSIARALLLIGSSEPKRILCAREIQKSIDESVHKLLSDQIINLGLQGFYDVQNNCITGKNGTEITFHGLKHNINNIKSIEGTDIVWLEEANNTSHKTWDTLEPTIRKDGSEIWMSFNPDLEEDLPYKMFVVDPPPYAKVVKVNYTDNPWRSKVLDLARERMKAESMDKFLHVYEGHCKQSLEGAVYEDELRDATVQGRICKVPYMPGKGVHVFCDLGWSDYTSLWFIQKVGMEFRALRCYQDRHKLWPHYLKVIQESGYLIDTIWLPHDGGNGSAIGESIENQTRSAGKRCIVLKNEHDAVINGINAARSLFPAVYFDQEGCADGLQSLRRYVWETTASGNSTREPKHDEHSHYADAFRYFAVGFREGKPQTEAATALNAKLARKRVIEMPRPGTGWMS